MKLNKTAALAVAGLAALTMFMGACESGYSDTPEATRTRVTTPRPRSERTPAVTESPATAVATAQPALSTPSTTAVPAPSTQLNLVASSVRFEQPALIAPAGIITIAFDNRDEGVPHNVHIFAGTSASGADVGSTEIQTGAVQQTLALGDLVAGSYFFQCDVHPSQMMGTLTVS